MKCFITGATGFIGNRLLEELLRNENEVHILARSPEKLNIPEKRVTVFKGDLFSTDVLEKAITGCDVVYHLAAYANLWSKDKTLAYKTNYTGTKNVLEAAFRNNIKKVVFTSSAATLPPSKEMEEVDETAPLPDTYLTDYETTKRQAENLCVEYFKKGLDVVVVNPPRLYGPGFLNKSNSVTIMIKKYIEGSWRFIPGDGFQLGSYVFVEDVIRGHIQAMKKGIPGKKYILGGENVSYNDFFKILSELTGKKRVMFHIPFSFMLGISKFELFMAETFGKPPLITPPWVKRYLQHRPLNSKKAIRELDYQITPLREGMLKTIAWLKTGLYE
ncbi:NAD-dependent epimerase/dehydratase family protein [Maribellus maritimus]|uniref:NAD-dependent epimerase/dehydratase family protein n=1 Tax=Maribellus maritimus TaxID=2870838 RepID=UPI001EECAF53|nr:NAD-dependent epimerase/dehydratase family protein [Maribellus maritimus]MCG6189638.1 NAD-dependent epimerase/dehydratase family protein [Maribellus maritimus]